MTTVVTDRKTYVRFLLFEGYSYSWIVFSLIARRSPVQSWSSTISKWRWSAIGGLSHGRSEAGRIVYSMALNSEGQVNVKSGET
jgi:hypothetical protein